MENERIAYFDWIRGLMILWMLIYHISLNYGRITFAVPEDGASIFTAMSFFMAPFYVGAGYFFSFKKDFGTFFKNQIKKYLFRIASLQYLGLLFLNHSR